MLEVTKDDVQERLELDSSPTRRIKNSHELTIHGRDDNVVNVSSAHKHAKAIQNHELKIIDGADHNFNGLKNMDELVSTISTFMGKPYEARINTKPELRPVKNHHDPLIDAFDLSPNNG